MLVLSAFIWSEIELASHLIKVYFLEIFLAGGREQEVLLWFRHFRTGLRDWERGH